MAHGSSSSSSQSSRSACVLIAGGSGFVGSRLVKHLAFAGYKDLTVLSRSPADAKRQLAKVLSSLDDQSLLEERKAQLDGPTTTCVRFVSALEEDASSTLPVLLRCSYDHTKEKGTLRLLPEEQGDQGSGVCTLGPFDAVVNLAGHNIAEKRWNKEVRRKMVDSRLSVTQSLVEFVERQPPQRKPKVFVQGSAIGYYGTHLKTSFSETTPVAPEVLDEIAAKHFASRCATGAATESQGEESWIEASSPATLFHLLCRANEAATLRISDKEETLVHILRTSMVLGKEGGSFPELALPFRLGAGATIGDGQQYMSWIHVADVCSVIEEIIARSLSELDRSSMAKGRITETTLPAERSFGIPYADAYVWNLAADDARTNLDFSKTLASVLRRPCLLSLPSFAVRLMFGEMADAILLVGQQVVPKHLQDAEFWQFRYPKLEEALQDICHG